VIGPGRKEGRAPSLGDERCQPRAGAIAPSPLRQTGRRAVTAPLERIKRAAGAGSFAGMAESGQRAGNSPEGRIRNSRSTDGSARAPLGACGFKSRGVARRASPLPRVKVPLPALLSRASPVRRPHHGPASSWTHRRRRSAHRRLTTDRLCQAVLNDSPQPHVETALGFLTTNPPPMSLSDWKSMSEPAMNGMLDLSTMSLAPYWLMT